VIRSESIASGAEAMENGLCPGPVGSGIVGDVFVAISESDDSYYLSIMPDWTPTLPSARPGRFKMTDLLNFAGVALPLWTRYHRLE
jgi:hypothetical protein